MLIMLPDVLNGKISVGLYISIVTAVFGLVQLMINFILETGKTYALVGENGSIFPR